MNLMGKTKVPVIVLSILLLLSTGVFIKELSDYGEPSRMTIITSPGFGDFGIQDDMMGSDAYWQKNVHSGLLASVVDQTEYWQPDLAEDLPVAIEQSDGTYIASITLKPNLKFASGNDLTVEDVIFSYKLDMTESINNDGLYNYLTDYLENNESITYEGNTLYFHFKQYNLAAMRVFGMFINEKAVYQLIYESCERGDEEKCVWQNSNGFFSQGAGPYKFTSYQNGTVETLLLEKNPYYWDNENVLIDEILYHNIKDTSAALTLLENSTIDLFDSFYAINSTTYEAYPEMISFKVPTATAVDLIWLNHFHPIFGNGIDTPIGKSDPSQAYEGAKNVRKALTHLIDRDWVVETVYAGLADPAVTIVPSNSYGFDETLAPYPYDIEIAKSFMEQSGYDYSLLHDTDNDGLYDDYFFNITLHTSDWNDRRIEWSSQIVTEAAKIGINITNIPMLVSAFDVGGLFGDYSSPALPANQGGFDLMSIGEGFFKNWYFGHDFSNESLFPEGENYGNYVNDSLAELFQTYNAETDKSARSSTLYEIQNHLREEVVHLPVVYPFSMYGIHCRMNGIEDLLEDYLMPWKDRKSVV